jgi:hypothetical protein
VDRHARVGYFRDERVLPREQIGDFDVEPIAIEVSD